MEEKRRHPRTSVSVSVDVLNFNARTRDVGRFVDLGAGGACLDLDGSYEVGSLLQISFELPPHEGAITCKGVVRQQLDKGVRVEFLQTDSTDRDFINTFVVDHPAS